jgi:hypothetical protein
VFAAESGGEGIGILCEIMEKCGTGGRVKTAAVYIMRFFFIEEETGLRLDARRAASHSFALSCATCTASFKILILAFNFITLNTFALHVSNCYISYNMLRPTWPSTSAGNVPRIREKRNAYRLLVGKPEEKRPLGRPICRWVDNIRMDLGEVGWGDVDWIGLAKDRNRWRALVNSVLNLRVP